MTTTQAATAVELHMIGRPLPHVLDDWPALTEVVHRRPSFGDPPEAFVAYNQALGPFPTEDLRRVGRVGEARLGPIGVVCHDDFLKRRELGRGTQAPSRLING